MLEIDAAANHSRLRVFSRGFKRTLAKQTSPRIAVMGWRESDSFVYSFSGRAQDQMDTIGSGDYKTGRLVKGVDNIRQPGMAGIRCGRAAIDFERRRSVDRDTKEQ